ncbi:MAG: GntR family transcriptional regulator [Phycisphaeraceae bacterium]|nr:GntR family transcriptional regulator [Phycisphaeraceae bacterium]
MLDSSSLLKTADISMPRVSQIKQTIRGQVHSGKLKTGEKLPSLSQLAILFECSLGLVRQAINTLIAEGLLMSQPRKGVFVSESRVAVSDIAFVTPTGHMENIQHIFEGVQTGVEQSPYRVVLHAANYDFDQEMSLLNDLDPQSYAGVLIQPPPFVEQMAPVVKFSERGIPVVQVGRSLVGLDIDAVVADGVELGRIAMEHLVSHGHKQIGCVDSKTDYHFNNEIAQGFDLALNPIGRSMDDIAVAHISATDLNRQQPWLNGQKAAAYLLDEYPNLTAIIGMNPHMTLGIYKAVQQAGKVVGRDISVIGLFADMSFFTALEPTVTVVCCDLNQIGQRAALLLRQRIENPNTPHRTICLSSKLIARQSVQSVR